MHFLIAGVWHFCVVEILRNGTLLSFSQLVLPSTLAYILTSAEVLMATNLIFLLCSGQGETVISILTDLNGFWTYENREVLLADNQDGGTP